MRARASISLVTLLSIFLIYLLSVILLIAVSFQLIEGIDLSDNLFVILFAAAAILLPSVLLIALLVNIVRLVREVRENQPGSRFKVRLLLFFSLIVLLTSIPQGIITINFINLGLGRWYSPSAGDAMESGLFFASDGYNRRADELESFSPLFVRLLPGTEDNFSRLWNRMREVNSPIDSVQVFSSEGDLEFSAGNSVYFISADEARNARQDQIVRDIRDGQSSVRIKIQETINEEGKEYWFILSIGLPESFNDRVASIRTGLEEYRQYQEFNENLLIGVILIYAALSLPLLLMALLLSFYLSDELMMPIRGLEEATQKVSEGDFSYRILNKSRDDLGHLVSSFNQMISQLEHSRYRLLQSERVSAWQEIAQRLAHEIKNPLTPIKLSAQRIAKKVEDGADDLGKIVPRSVDAIIKEVDHLSLMLTEFRNFAKLPAPFLESINLLSIVNEISQLNSTKTVEIQQKAIAEDIFVLADANQLKQVITNLVQNAIEAFTEDGFIRFVASRVMRSNRAFIRIQVIDNAVGMDDEILEQIFDPYFTTKKDGTGLGMAIVQRIVIDHGGQIWVESTKGIGTTFFIDLPEAIKEEDKKN
jgi:two-component system nitrogen regulation sensor histidine kinase NtrY